MRQSDRPEASPESDSLDVDEAIAILSDETRVQIIFALGEAWSNLPDGSAGLSYSDLMERVGARDSGRFNYHLQQLVGPLVKKTDDGYGLRNTGHSLYQWLIGGTLPQPETPERETGTCPHCGAAITVRCSTDLLVISHCESCDTTLDRIPISPRLAVQRDGEELLEAAIFQQYHDLSMHRRGVCNGCGGRVESRYEFSDDGWSPPFDSEVYCLLQCQACYYQLITEPSHVALTTPAVGAFLESHGRDPAAVRSWEPLLAKAKDGKRIVSEDPIRVMIPFEIAGERLEIHLDEGLHVGETTRVTR